MASAMAYFQANRGKLSGQISANVVSSSRTSEGINYTYSSLRVYSSSKLNGYYSITTVLKIFCKWLSH